jgi:Flp pilus assembly CpaE family ATPase
MSVPFRTDDDSSLPPHPVASAPQPPDFPATVEPHRPTVSRPNATPGQVLRSLAALEQAPVLFALPDHQLRRLARRMWTLDVVDGATVVEQGATGDSLYVVEQGACVMTVVHEGQPSPVSRLGPGDVFGESALLGEPSPVAVAAAGRCRLLVIDGTSLRAAVPPGGLEATELREQAARRQTMQVELAARVRGVASISAGEGVVVAVYAPKGGSGRTTIALNLAAQLSRARPGNVLVLDLDLPFTPAALLSGLVPTGSLMRASWAASLGTMAELRDELVNASLLHPGGYMLLPGVLRVEESELLTTEQVVGAVHALRGAFGHIVVDLGSSLGDTTLSICDLARHVVLVVSPELPSLKGARDVLRLLHDNLHLPDERVTLVLNRRQPDQVVPRESVTRSLGRAPDVEVSYDGSRPERAALTGAALVMSDPKSEITRGTRRLADLITGAPGTKPQ